jgi:hypothetical protein
MKLFKGRKKSFKYHYVSMVICPRLKHLTVKGNILVINSNSLGVLLRPSNGFYKGKDLQQRADGRMVSYKSVGSQ